MWNRTLSRSTTLQRASVLSMLLTFAVTTAAGAQSLPGTDALPSGGAGAGVTTSPDGLQVGVETGPTGGVTLGAGPNGVELGLRASPPAAATPGGGAGRPVSTPGAPTGGVSSPAPERSNRSPEPAGSGRGARGGQGHRARSGRDGTAARGGEATPRTTAANDLRPAARTDAEGKGGIAPVFDLVDRIPAAVRAGLVALAAIALAMWGLWVRGRRRLQRNAYLDPDTGVGNMAAFEQVLEREWQRAARFRRPLGLLLLELERRGPGGMVLLGEREARDAVHGISQELREADIVARLAPSRFAIICPEAPQGSVETLAHALEHRIEERRLRCWTGFAERHEDDTRPADLVSRAAAQLADLQLHPVEDDMAPGHESQTVALPQAGGVAA